MTANDKCLAVERKLVLEAISFRACSICYRLSFPSKQNAFVYNSWLVFSGVISGEVPISLFVYRSRPCLVNVMRRLVFVSYRRERGYALAHLVNAELRSRGLRTFIDVTESDPGQFWAQAEAAIRSCCALVLICTNGSFQAKTADDWVLREVSEALKLGRLIIPVFSQDFEPPSALPLALAQAIQYNGVSMDTQFHVAAFDHLSQMVGGRKRSEQRRRVAIFWSLASLTLLALLALGAREIIRLNGEVRQEREARKAMEQRSADERRSVAARNQCEQQRNWCETPCYDRTGKEREQCLDVCRLLAEACQ